MGVVRKGSTRYITFVAERHINHSLCGCVLHRSSVDLQVVEVVQHGTESPARLYVVHFLCQLEGENNHSDYVCIYQIKRILVCEELTHYSLI